MRCEHCNTEIEPTIRTHKRFCSKSCSNAAYRERMASKTHVRAERPDPFGRSLAASPQRISIHGIPIPVIAPEYRFLYQNGNGSCSGE